MSKPMTDYEKKLIDMQLGLRANQNEMKDTFADLDSWSKEIKVKEKKLLDNPESFKDSNKGLPPIRALAATKKKKRVKKPETNKPEGTKNLKKQVVPRDARAWDKLDVDKMCEEVDTHKSSESEYTTDEEWEEEQKKVRANWEKERGNVFFKDNMYNEAINCYTSAMELDPLNNIYPANRAMCLMKQEKYGAAENDCTLSINMNASYVKAYHRRATCRRHLKKFEDSKKDLEELLKLEPTNKIAQLELNQVIQLIDTRQLVFPISKKDSEKSKKELKRILIEEINDDENSERAEMERTQEQMKQRFQLDSKEEKLFEVSKSSNKPISGKKIEEISETVDKIDIKKIEPVNEKTSHAEKKPPVVKKAIPDAPTNGYQFKKDWQFLSNNSDDLAEYFKKIPPNQYKSLFMNGLESDYLSKILIIFKKFYYDDVQALYLRLKCLSEVKRFKTQLMFLSSEDTRIIKQLLDQLNSSNSISSYDLSQLKENYTD